MRAQRLPGGARLHDVAAALRQHLIPENHVADEAVFGLHGEEAAQIALGERIFAEPCQDHDVKAGIPEPLERVGFQRRRYVAVVLAQQA
jgi:hypothetical protein